MGKSSASQLRRLLARQALDSKRLVKKLAEAHVISVRLDRRRAQIAEAIGQAEAGDQSVVNYRQVRELKGLLRSEARTGVTRLELEPVHDGGRAEIQGRIPVWLTRREFELVQHVASADVAEDGFPDWTALAELQQRIRRDGRPTTKHNLHTLINRIRDKFVEAEINPFVLATEEVRGVRVLVRVVAWTGEGAVACGDPRPLPTPANRQAADDGTAGNQRSSPSR